jgi:rhodanese-related sulfurtransferase
MKKLSFYLIALLFVSSITLTSCKDDPVEEIKDPAFTVLTDYLVANSMDLNNIKGEKGTSTFFVTGGPAAGSTPTEIATWAADYTIIDIRGADDYNSGYIVGATNVTWDNIKTAAENAENRPLIVCYTGQSACYATALLRLSGIDAVALKWGMSGWHSDFSTKWDNQIGSAHAETYSDNWTDGAAPANVEYNDPELTETIEDGAALLDARVDAVFADGFKAVGAETVITTPTDYFINNYFSEAHYTGFGHIAGAYRIFDNFTLSKGDINKLDATKDVVTYCYTGQTSAVITAWLRVLGYEAYSLAYGMNGLYNSSTFWTSGEVKNQWGVNANPKDLDYEGLTK